MRPLDVGRLPIDFYVRSNLEQTTLSELRGLPAPLAVSTLEATTLDLVVFNWRIGGVRQVAEVIAGMKPVLSEAELRRALPGEPQTAVKKRLGYVLEVMGLTKLATVVEKALPARLAPAVLQTLSKGTPPPGDAIGPWTVVDNIELRREVE